MTSTFSNSHTSQHLFFWPLTSNSHPNCTLCHGGNVPSHSCQKSLGKIRTMGIVWSTVTQSQDLTHFAIAIVGLWASKLALLGSFKFKNYLLSIAISPCLIPLVEKFVDVEQQREKLVCICARKAHLDESRGQNFACETERESKELMRLCC